MPESGIGPLFDSPLCQPPGPGQPTCGDVSPYTGRVCMAVLGHAGGHEWTDHGDTWSTWPRRWDEVYG